MEDELVVVIIDLRLGTTSIQFSKQIKENELVQKAVDKILAKELRLLVPSLIREIGREEKKNGRNVLSRTNS